MLTYRLDFSYNGAHFYGYAKQPDLRTIQGEMEQALAPYTQGAATVVAGRTDKGVHAYHQVMSFRCPELDTGRVLRSLNAQLGSEIVLRSLVDVPDGFHARFGAEGRAYRYRINNAPLPDPLAAGTTWTFDEPLNVADMNGAVSPLVGSHDFAAFCRRQADLSTERNVFWIQWQRDGDLVELSIGANSFCHQMVRSIVGVSVEVGRGRVRPETVRDTLAATERHRTAGAVPPHGLVLSAIAYDGETLARPGWVSDTT